jgi:hypothetical protein
MDFIISAYIFSETYPITLSFSARSFLSFSFNLAIISSFSALSPLPAAAP